MEQKRRPMKSSSPGLEVANREPVNSRDSFMDLAAGEEASFMILEPDCEIESITKTPTLGVAIDPSLHLYFIVRPFQVNQCYSYWLDGRNTEQGQ